MILAMRYAWAVLRLGAARRKLEGYQYQLANELRLSQKTKDKAVKIVCTSNAAIKLIEAMQEKVDAELKDLDTKQKLLDQTFGSRR